MYGDIISELRKDAGMTQKELAEYLKTSIATISHYETETNAPDLQSMIRLADFFGVSLDYLAGRTRLRMDFNTFSREVRLINGSTTSAERVLTQFLQLSDKSQAAIIDLISLYKMKDSLRQEEIRKPISLNNGL